MAETIYQKPALLTAALFEAGFPVSGVSSNGEITFTRDLTKNEKKNLDTFLESWDDSPSTDEQRLEAYKEAGITAEKLIFALWKELKKGDISDAAALEEKINAIDALIN